MNTVIKAIERKEKLDQSLNSLIEKRKKILNMALSRESIYLLNYNTQQLAMNTGFDIKIIPSIYN